MRAEPTYNKHLCALAAIFILGDTVIVLPYASSGDYAIWGFAAAAVLSVILFLAALPLARQVLARPAANTAARLFSAFLLTAAAAYAFYNAGITFIRYLNFVNRVLLPDTHKFFIALLFLVPVAYLAGRRQEVLLKLSLLFILAAAVTVLLFFLLSAKDFRAENIAVYRFPDLRELWDDTKPYFLSVSLPALLIPTYGALFTGKNHAFAPFLGLLTGLILIALCLTDCLLLFGAPLAARLEFPLSSAVSTVTVGPLFTRMDGIVYCLFFASALIKTAVCMKLSFFALRRGLN